eukprot:TRINITY_DN935_c0_g1_i1.p1 TRINITY_DN935_c0_g1~~TRINITY_DN935_c0_g1_i1.p1  ORF type:complete len:196 (+),score=23.07 TRINITY_DN935_c0_g1_i1:59-589(+)
MSDLLIAIVGENFVLMGADSSQTRSVLMLKDDEDKIMTLDSHKLLGGSGEQGDRVQFTEYIQKNVALYQLRTGIALSTHAAANFTRRELATALRSNPYSVNLLLAGFDASATDAGNGTASLYFIDYLSSLHKVNFACQVQCFFRSLSHHPISISISPRHASAPTSASLIIIIRIER